MKKLKDPAEPLARLFGCARKLGAHLGPVLYQLPPHWHCNVGRLRQFITQLPRGLQHVFEFRDSSWYNEEVRSLLSETDMGFCIHDLRGCSCPIWTTGPLVYLRFHGPTQAAYAGRYDVKQLRKWAETIREFCTSGRDVYIYFNNDANAYAVANARELRNLLSA
jgi:uncharacterized protein YecE (DUF72 family)